MVSVLDRYTAVALKSLLIVLPSLVLFFVMVIDTVSTDLGIEVGLVEANPKYYHFNVYGVGSDDYFERIVMGAMLSVIFLMSNVVVFEMSDIRGWWFFALISIILWIFLFYEVVTVYSNLIRVVTALA